MKRWLILSWVAVLALPAAAGCDCGSKGKSEQPGKSGAPKTVGPPSAPPDILLRRALKAAGGAEKLRAASTFRAQYRSKSATGHIEKGELFYRPGASRLRVTSPMGESHDVLTSQTGCAHFYDPVVVRCSPNDTRRARHYQVAYEASWLWPLGEKPWSLKASSESIDGVTYDTLLARKQGHAFDAFLYLDPESSRVTRLSVRYGDDNAFQTRLSVRSQFQQICGAELPLQEEAFLDGEKIFTAELSDVQCGGVTSQAVAIPKQVADGTVTERSLPERSLLCRTESGPYAKLGPMFDKLQAYGKKRGLLRQRKVGWVVFASAPASDAPLPQFSRLCIEVASKPPAEPERDGAFVLRRWPPEKVLSAFGIGAYDQQVTRLYELLQAEAKKREIEPSGEIRQLGYMVPKDAPKSDRVTELQWVVVGSPE